MPLVTVDVDVELDELCDVGKLKKLVGYGLLSPDETVRNAAESLNKDLWLNVKIGDKHCPIPKCDIAYRKWLAERAG